jgi:hypothetical protein
MDAAEKWLAANDPDYEARDWNDEDGDPEYVDRPGQEVPIGGPVELQQAVDSGSGSLVRGVQDKLCVGCYGLFVPMMPWHRFCAERCRWRYQKRQQRSN